MEFFRNSNIDFLSKKWFFLAMSLIFSVGGVLSMVFWHGIPLGVDFRGGTLVYVKFTHTPNDNEIRHKMDAANLKNVKIQRYGLIANNEVLISLEESQTSENALDQGKNSIIKALEPANPEGGKQDLNNASVLNVTDTLLTKDPLHAGTDAQARYSTLARAIVDYRDKTRGGAIGNFNELSAVTQPAVISALQENYFLSDFGVRNVEIVGPQVGQQLRKQAALAVVYSLAGMLVYLWFRFELIYGVAAVVAVFHDTLITVGMFSIFNKEISLTVIAAILTLVGYSMNDTIVVFDRIRENIKMMRRERLTDIVNKSINQTLSRTVLTSGLTFLTVLALFLFGGEVLHGFSFALVIGIIIGTYSSIFIAAPMLVAYQDWRERGGRGRATLPAEPARKDKVRVKA